MNALPDFIGQALKSPEDQTYQGLNLVLELEDASKLPLMLWDIVLAQDTIKRALEELSFVHYARFVPSYDGRALMVITEFDGDLDPYVLDFVIALGDVFDVLLSYVRRTRDFPGPVRENPQGFAQWVREHNRVPFFPGIAGLPPFRFPADFDYPVYSAYPDKTVTDIAGARSKPLSPALDHPAAVVDEADVQGNILRGYGPRHGRYLFFTVTDAAQARRWLARDLLQPGTPWGGIGTAAGWTGQPPAVLTQVALTHAGMQELLPEAGAALKGFPAAFRSGAAARAEDNGDLGDSAPDTWLFGGPTDPVHVVLFVYTKVDPAPMAFLGAVAALQTPGTNGLKWLRTLDGVRLPDPSDPKDRYGTEPFGFVDGISDPPVSGQCPASEPALQPAASPGEFLLHKHYSSIYGGRSLGRLPERLASNGSFGVLRLMEQDVDKFKTSTDAEAARLGIDPGLLRAKLVGRWPDGTPLALSPDATVKPPQKTNAFDYAPSWEFPDVPNDHLGLRCPVGAHVRRSNPRTARVAGQRHSHRLLRRGMASRWPDGTTVRQGLMGLFMGADIERQFEFIQRQWLQRDLSASGIRGTTDAIAAIRSGDTPFEFLMPDPACPHAPPRRLVAHIPPLVRTRGCLYLFFPGIGGLRSLDGAAAPAPASGRQAEAANARAAAKAAVGAAVSALRALAPRPDGPAAPAADPGRKAVKNLLGKLPAKVSIVLDAAVDAAEEAASDVTDAAASVATHLDGVLARDFLDLQPRLDALLAVPALAGLAGGKWKELVQALTDRTVESKRFQLFVQAMALPRPVVHGGRPAGVHDAGADIDFDDARFRADPFPVLNRLRHAGHRIVWVPAQQACWVLGHADCKDLLGRHGDFVQAPSGTKRRGIVTLDQPRHTEVRGAFEAAFRAALQRLAQRDVIEDVVRTRLSALLKGSRRWHFDLMRDYAQPVARQVVWQLMGIDDAEEQARCDALANRLVMRHGKSATAGAVDALVSADAGVRLAARLALPLSHAWLVSSFPGNKYKGTLIGELAARMAPGLKVPHERVLDFEEVLITLVQTVLASQSPHFLLGSAALHLMTPAAAGDSGQTPWQALHALKHQPTQFGQALSRALDEARRVQPPLTLIERYAAGEQRICDVTVPDGCAVFAMVASANRDATVFGADAEQFRADRLITDGQLLSLGHGIHECAGRDLQARLVPLALGALVTALGDLRLRNPAAFPAWQSTVYFRVLQGLSVTCCPP